MTSITMSRNDSAQNCSALPPAIPTSPGASGRVVLGRLVVVLSTAACANVVAIAAQIVGGVS
jgi:hypothetical protein